MEIRYSMSTMRRSAIMAISVLTVVINLAQSAAAQTADMTRGDSSESFDLASVPVSERTLGAFPFISLPEGYEAINEQTLNLARVPFWTGDRLENVEGKTYMAILQEKSEWTYSDLELKRNFQYLVEQAGGVLVTDSAIAPDILEGVSRDVRVSLVDGWGDVYNNPVQTYVIRSADKTVWLHLCGDSAGMGVIIVELKAFEPTASLLSADALKREIGSRGNVSIGVNFAVDKADILPTSMTQIEQVASMLKYDPALKLSINGHTDATGDASHNQRLSEARAQSVVTALVARGIDASRLQATGLGQSEPVADNATEDGRMLNRRVELVRIE